MKERGADFEEEVVHVVEGRRRSELLVLIFPSRPELRGVLVLGFKQTAWVKCRLGRERPHTRRKPGISHNGHAKPTSGEKGRFNLDSARRFGQADVPVTDGCNYSQVWFGGSSEGEVCVGGR